MKKAYVLAGVPASGKSTYTKTVDKGTTVFSSDEIRQELFGSLSNPDVYTKQNHSKVFDTLYKRAIESTSQEVIIDSTNLTRKSRVRLYKLLKSKGFNEVEVIMFIEPLSVLLSRNQNRENKVPEWKLKQMYIQLEPPKVGIDCDNYKVITENPFLIPGANPLSFSIEASIKGIKEAVKLNVNKEYIKELNNGDLTVEHDTPYHLETIEEHINMCTAFASNVKPLYLITAAYHDLGKYVTKDGGRYLGHANVSAMYALNVDNNEPIFESAVEIIYHHMNVHQGLSDKYINKHGIDDMLLSRIEDFKNIDNVCRRTELE